MEERGTGEGSPEKPPPFAFRGCRRETQAPRPRWRDAPGLVAVSPTTSPFVSVGPVLFVRGGGEGWINV